jgi:uncharacterized protein (TIGR03067 family)
MMDKVLLMLVLAVSTTLAKADDPNSRDLAEMQGDWMVASMVTGGAKVPEDEAQALFRSVTAQRYTVSRYRKVIGAGTFKIDARNSPKTIDSSPTGPADQVKSILGIYEFDGKRLKICNAQPGKPRPTNFEAQLGSGHTLIVWEPESKQAP